MTGRIDKGASHRHSSGSSPYLPNNRYGSLGIQA